MGRRTGVGDMLVPRGSWVLALWSHFGNVWIDLPIFVSNCIKPAYFCLVKLGHFAYTLSP